MNAYDHNFALFEVAAKALLWKNGKILLLEFTDGNYDFPGGRMDNSEKDLSLVDILTREIAEELGKTIKFEVKDVAFVTKRYYERDGKEHNILATYFNVNLTSGDVVLSDEHTDFSWIDPKSILSHPENFTTSDEYEQYKKYFEQHDDRPKVGVGILLIKDGKQLLLGKRKASHGQGEYALPGGHLEHNESFEECVNRELREEAGEDIKVSQPKFLCVTNLRKYPPKHYVDIGMTVSWVSGNPKLMEPDKNEGWRWFDLDNLPSPLFGCTENYITARQTGQSYFLD